MPVTPYLGGQWSPQRRHMILTLLLVCACARSPAPQPPLATVPPPPGASSTFAPKSTAPLQIVSTPTPFRNGVLTSTQTPTSAVLPSPTPAAITPVVWDVYDPNTEHLWNRLFHALYGRTAGNGQEYGREELDPLLWQETNALITGPSHQRALAVLDEFLNTHGERLITDPVRRAMLQRDLWAVFDWLTFQPSGDLAARGELEQRLAQVIRRLALGRQQIDALPNSYDAALQSGAFPAEYQLANPQAAFLPAGLFTAGDEWIDLGRQGGPMAMTHLQELPILGRSALLVFLRVPGGRGAGLAYLNALPKLPHPNPPAGTEVALVRRMLLIDDQGEIVPAPLIESIQLRRFDQDTTQHYFEFALDRARLFAAETGGLRDIMPNDRDFMLFESQGDFMQFPVLTDDLRPPVLSTCQGCHFDGLQGISGADSILSFSRARFPLPDRQLPVLAITTPDQETQTTIAWKMAQTSWQQLLALWSKP
jgi:hypothetical protein